MSYFNEQNGLLVSPALITFNDIFFCRAFNWEVLLGRVNAVLIPV